MKIIFCQEVTLAKKLLHKQSMGGIETTTWDHINELRRRGHEVMVNQPFPDGSIPDVVSSSTYGPYVQELLFKYKAKYHCACLQHAHTTVEDLQGGFIPKSMGFLNGFVPVYIRKLYSFAHIIVTPTAFSKRCLQNAGVKKLIYVMSSGVHTEPLIGGSENRSHFREFLREKYHVPEDQFVVANVGYTWERKGIDKFFFTAKKMPHVFFVWTGPKINSKWLAAAETLPNVAFPGFYPDIRDVYYGADLFFFPSKVENLGLPLIEASMCRLPVLSSRIPAFEWLVEDDYCLKGDSSEDFKNKIQLLIDQPQLRQELANKAHDLAIDLHAFENIGPRLEYFYQLAIKINEIYHRKYHIFK